MRQLITTMDLDKNEILALFADARIFLDPPPNYPPHHELLKHKKIATIFFENSTRTLLSFENAAKNLGAAVLRLDVSRSSTAKGETLRDTAANLAAMSPDALIIRHAHSGVPALLASHLANFDCALLNGGDGRHAHPTQALLDLFTIFEHFGGDVAGKKVLIIGDIKNSRVANSNIELLTRFGLDLTLVAPRQFMPPVRLKKSFTLDPSLIARADIIMALRTQIERHGQPSYASLRDYASDFCLTKERLKAAKPGVILLHPGPVNWGVDLGEELIDDPRSLILEQVKNGVAVRMAVLKKLILEKRSKDEQAG